MEEYKSNTHKSKQVSTPVPEKKVEKVVTSKVSRKKRSNVKGLLISDEAKNVKSYIFMDVLIPAAKKAISDIVSNGIDMILYGETKHKSKNPTNGISYRSYYDKKDEDRRYDTRRARPGYVQDDIILERRDEADSVLERMDEMLSAYGVVSVADYYELVGEPFEYTDNKYGWTNLRNAEVRRTSEGYVLKLPSARPIE